MTFALTGTQEEMSHWARWKKREFNFTKWISIPYPEFNHRHNGRFELAANPSWGLIKKPNQ